MIWLTMPKSKRGVIGFTMNWSELELWWSNALIKVVLLAQQPLLFILFPQQASSLYWFIPIDFNLPPQK